MAETTIQALSKAIEAGKFAPAYYFHGTEEGLKDEAVARLLDAVLDPGLRDFNLEQRSLAQLDPEGLDTALNTLPMMADRRLVILRDLEQVKRKTKLKKALERYLERPAEGTVLVLVENADPKGEGESKPDAALAKRATVVLFEPMEVDEAVRWVLREVSRNKVTLAEDAATHLVNVTGTSTLALRSELEKVYALGEGARIDADRLGELVGVRRGETPLDWRDAVLSDRTADALAMLDTVLSQSGVSGVRLVMMLGQGLVGAGVAQPFTRRARGPKAVVDAIVKQVLLRLRPAGLGKWRDEAESWAGWAPKWPAERLRRGLEAMLDADKALKSTRISDETGVITDLVLTLRHTRQEAAA